MNQTRLKALNDAAKDVCMYCGGRAPQYNRNPVHDPSGSGNWVHTVSGGGKPELCAATAIFNRINFGSASSFESRMRDALVEEIQPEPD